MFEVVHGMEVGGVPDACVLLQVAVVPVEVVVVEVWLLWRCEEVYVVVVAGGVVKVWL